MFRSVLCFSWSLSPAGLSFCHHLSAYHVDEGHWRLSGPAIIYNTIEVLIFTEDGVFVQLISREPETDGFMWIAI